MYMSGFKNFMLFEMGLVEQAVHSWWFCVHKLSMFIYLSMVVTKHRLMLPFFLLFKINIAIRSYHATQPQQTKDIQERMKGKIQMHNCIFWYL